MGSEIEEPELGVRHWAANIAENPENRIADIGGSRFNGAKFVTCKG